VPVRRPPVPRVLWWLIGINVGVYALWNLVGPDPAWGELLAAHLLVSSEAVLSGRVWTLITSTFSHIDPTHLLFNMLALWVFGSDVCRLVGSRRFVYLYLVGGLLASVAHVVFSVLAADPTPALGASGSVMAVAAVFAALYPKRMLMVNFLIPVPAALAVGLYAVADVAGLIGQGSGIAHAAHLGGAAYGLGYWWLVIRPRRRGPGRAGPR